MRLSEEGVFFSIQGEGVHAGIPTAFVRFQGCNVRCKWCDTVHAIDPKGGKGASMEDIVQLLKPYDCDWVCLTGGEPLMQKDLGELVSRIKKSSGRSIEVFTNGMIEPPSWMYDVDSWVVDVKCPSSGVAGRYVSWWSQLRDQDSLKFTVAGEQDLDFLKKCLAGGGSLFRGEIVVSPVAGVESLWDRKWMERVVEFCKEYNLRYSLQIHKLIWGNRRGV